MVALGDAWQKGAQRWAYGKRVAFANDPLNLLAVSASANRQKGDGDTATWLPANKSFRCSYVARQVAVKLKFGLWVTGAGARCDASRPVGLPDDAPAGAWCLAGLLVGWREPPRTSEPPAGGSGSRVFQNCDAARAAGAHRSDAAHRCTRRTAASTATKTASPASSHVYGKCRHGDCKHLQANALTSGVPGVRPPQALPGCHPPEATWGGSYRPTPARLTSPLNCRRIVRHAMTTLPQRHHPIG